MSNSLLGQPHHDGSQLYVPRRAKLLGEKSVVRLRVPMASGYNTVFLRYVHDGEQGIAHAQITARVGADEFWSVELPQINPIMRYRFLLSRDGGSHSWFNGIGLVDHDPPDADDFVSRINFNGPEWPTKSVVYEIFPDRFATTNLNIETPKWARRREWSDLPSGPDWSSELFGGDLYGVAQHLDHIEELGADVIYFTPVFPANSAHRYDANNFDVIDPLLGGEIALEHVTKEAHARSIRVLGDLTLNHCGRGHKWFRAAEADSSSVEHGFFYYSPDENGIETPATWLGVDSLMKLNFASQELRKQFFLSPSSAARKWLTGINGLDGWRIDVANMSGRMGSHDVNHELSKQFVDACIETKPDVLVVGEHYFDSRDDLTNGGWHGVMAYMGFTRPVWCWLRGEVLPSDFPDNFMGVPGSIPRRRGQSMVAEIKQFMAGVPYDAVLRSWLILDSHDTPRFSTITGDDQRTKIGVGLQMTLPGIPMVWQGDEIGLGGTSCGEDSRRPMPWQDRASWNQELFSWYRKMISLRRSKTSLAIGSIRFVHVDDDSIAYIRETEGEALLCFAARSTHSAIEFSRSLLPCEEILTLVGRDLRIDGESLIIPAGRAGFHVWEISSLPTLSTKGY